MLPHLLIKKYMLPCPYVGMYLHGDKYAHHPFLQDLILFAMPSPNGMAEASGNTPGNMNADGTSANRVYSKSSANASESTSDRSDIVLA